ncbi:hypothetical protein CRE_21256 [Caenorhabditis remanei]|uniref:Uncharacterized protein n=1 Tax=Caenorhabditis remanei TaxID=31234 RepID=E3MF49_CAERE|nr:hypothetical protein CRE_21256 [Caenorhabditis remanei]
MSQKSEESWTKWQYSYDDTSRFTLAVQSCNRGLDLAMLKKGYIHERPPVCRQPAQTP